MLFLTTCSPKTTEGLRLVTPDNSEIKNPYFSDRATDYVYKAKIDIYGRYFGGILIIKKVEEDAHRVVFTTEFGSKIFDFLYEGDTFTKNFMIADLDKRIIVNTLADDFRIMISEKAYVVEQYASETKTIYKTQGDKRFNFYFYDTNSGILERIVNSSQRKEKIAFIFRSEAQDLAENISIKHSNISLAIDLSYFKSD